MPAFRQSTPGKAARRPRCFPLRAARTILNVLDCVKWTGRQRSIVHYCQKMFGNRKRFERGACALPVHATPSGRRKLEYSKCGILRWIAAVDLPDASRTCGRMTSVLPAVDVHDTTCAESTYSRTLSAASRPSLCEPGGTCGQPLAGIAVSRCRRMVTICSSASIGGCRFKEVGDQRQARLVESGACGGGRLCHAC